MRIEKLKANYDLDLEYVHFPLHPDTPPEGRALLDLFGGPAAAQRVEDSYRRLKGLADQEGLPLAKRTMTYNTRLAQELGVWARREGAGDAFDSAVFRAYFADARDISKPEVLVEIAASVGLDAKTAAAVLKERRFRDEVDALWERSRKDGVNAVPTFVAGGRKVVGAQPYPVLEALVVSAGARKKADGGS